MKTWLKLYFSILDHITGNILNYRNKNTSQLSNYKLDTIHIKKTKLVKDRNNLLDILPKQGIIAELGVDIGEFSNRILEISKPKKLHLIDFWGTKRYNNIKKRYVENRFKNEIHNGIIEINIGNSTEIFDIFPDNYFDWIYIDTDHSYKTTITELELYKNKMKNTGIICGHDYIIGNWKSYIKYGVIEAVTEFCVKNKWEILYLTTDFNEYPSFAIRKII